MLHMEIKSTNIYKLKIKAFNKYLFLERQKAKMIPIYRYHAVQSDGWRFHFSTNPQVGQGWTFDGVAFGAPVDSDSNGVPLFQFHYDQDATYGGWRFNYNTSMQPAS